MLRHGLIKLASHQQLQQKLDLVNKKLVRTLTSDGSSPRSKLAGINLKLYPQVEQEINEEGFPILKLAPRRRNIFENRPKRPPRRQFYKLKFREEAMKENQDWPSVWPTAKTFSPSAVPLPIRQSYESKRGAVPRGKYANTELLKIANFLHLTPKAIGRHCAAIRKFCTPWPENLDTDEEIRQHFPVTFVTRDYINSSPTIRDPRARVVELHVNVSDLKLNHRDEQKLIELARHRYNHETGILMIVADACPARIQNQDYAEYLLSAVYFESQEHQEWEKDRVEEDAIFKIDLDDYKRDIEQKLGFAAK